VTRLPAGSEELLDKLVMVGRRMTGAAEPPPDEG
jgi:hypothetical protein